MPVCIDRCVLVRAYASARPSARASFTWRNERSIGKLHRERRGRNKVSRLDSFGQVDPGSRGLRVIRGVHDFVVRVNRGHKRRRRRRLLAASMLLPGRRLPFAG